MIWPVKYAPEMVERDVSVTFHTDGYDAGDWNTTCPTAAANIESLMQIIIDTIYLAKGGGGSHLDAIEKIPPFRFNQEYQTFTCYNVTSATDTLFDVLLHTLGGGSKSDKKCARHILFNKHAIAQKAYDRTVNQYPGTAATLQFADDMVVALLYDMNTGGNQGMLKLVNSWFDGEGNFIAFPTVVRQLSLIHISEPTRPY